MTTYCCSSEHFLSGIQHVLGHASTLHSFIYPTDSSAYRLVPLRVFLAGHGLGHLVFIMTQYLFNPPSYICVYPAILHPPAHLFNLSSHPLLLTPIQYSGSKFTPHLLSVPSFLKTPACIPFFMHCTSRESFCPQGTGLRGTGKPHLILA